MPKKPATPAEPEVVVDLRGKRGIDIAEMIVNGEITQEFADDFVATRAVNKLHGYVDKLQD